MSEHARLLPRYKHLRQVALELNTRLVHTLSKSILNEGGKKLGILTKKDVLTLDAEDELSVLMDYCIYDIRRKGKNAIERFVEKSPPPADSDEMVLLQAMRQARFGLVAVEAIERDVGVQVRELLRDEVLFVVDVGFSRSAPVGMILAARIMAPESITMTTGAPLPVAVLPPAQRGAFFQGITGRFTAEDYRNLSPEEASDVATGMIRFCLEHGAAEHIKYQAPGRRWGRGRTP